MIRTIATLLAMAVVLLVLVHLAEAKLDEKTVQKIMEALPAKAPVEPAKPRKVLLYSACTGFVHGGAIDAAKVAFPEMGKKTKAFEVVVSDDLANFEPDKIKEFSAIILSNCTGELFLPKGKRAADTSDEGVKKALELRKSFMDWINAGGGIVGIHAATDCSYQWAEYGDMIGEYFSGHPWNQLVGIKNDDPTHPLNAAFEGKGFEIKDEIYQFNRGRYSRDKMRVLLSLDMAKTPNRGQRKDQDYAITWIKTHGKGRVFYCALGHDANVFQDPKVLAHYLAGLQWAMGDLKADATPVPLKAEAKPAEK